MLDERWIRSLHVESMRRADLHRDREPHVLFQASTIGALLDGAFEGDLSFAELAEHGDLGLGTLNHLDGEMVALDGEFFRADVDGRLSRVAPEERTPFAGWTPRTTSTSSCHRGSSSGTPTSPRRLTPRSKQLSAASSGGRPPRTRCGRPLRSPAGAGRRPWSGRWGRG